MFHPVICGVLKSFDLRQNTNQGNQTFPFIFIRMKKSLFTALALSPLMLFAQDTPYKINGKVGSFNSPAKVYLIYQNGEASVTDSALISNGNFSFQGAISEPGSGVMIMDPKGVGLDSLKSTLQPDVLMIYVDKGEYSIESKDSLSTASIKGSKANTENKILNGRLKDLSAQFRALDAEYQAASAEQKGSQEFVGGLQGRLEKLQVRQKEILTQFVKENPESYVSVNSILSIAGRDPQFGEIDPLVKSLSPALQKAAALQPLLMSMEASKKTSVGAMAMDFTQNDPDGKPVKLSDFKGKYVLLDFWASWCGPCREENPNVVQAYNKFKDKNFTVLGVSLDRQNQRDAWLKAVKDDGLTWTQVSDLKFWNNEVARMYNIRSIPQNYLIDPAGKIVAVNLRGADLEKRLAELL